ncbi:MAG: hypothetical protein RR865_09565 [Clostridia bacterium]
MFLWLPLQIWEGIYYLAFILLTGIIVAYTVKAYSFQSKTISQLICKCVDSSNVHSRGTISLEIYNFGNTYAKDIKVTVQGKEYNIIPFIKPNESYYIPIATYSIYSSGVDFQPIAMNGNAVNGQLSVTVELDTNNCKSTHTLTITPRQFLNPASSDEQATLNTIRETLLTIEKHQKGIVQETKNVATAISKIKHT